MKHLEAQRIEANIPDNGYRKRDPRYEGQDKHQAKPDPLWDKRPKPEYNDEAASTAATIAASPETNVLRQSAVTTAEDVRVRQALGQPNGYSRTEEILAETDSYRITRSSDGTVRNDLHNRPALKAPVVQSPSRQSVGQTLTQEQIDQL